VYSWTVRRAWPTLPRWVNVEVELALLSRVNQKALEQKALETRGRAAAQPVEDQEALSPGTMGRELPDPVEHQIDHILPDRPVGARGVVRRVLLPGDHLLRMEQLAIHSVRTSSTDVGSRSMNTARGTCLPALVSEKNC
jgi:hypothetical protein